MLVLVYWNVNMIFDWINVKMDNLLNYIFVYIVLNIVFNLFDMWGVWYFYLSFWVIKLVIKF